MSRLFDPIGRFPYILGRSSVCTYIPNGLEHEWCDLQGVKGYYEKTYGLRQDSVDRDTFFSEVEIGLRATNRIARGAYGKPYVKVKSEVALDTDIEIEVARGRRWHNLEAWAQTGGEKQRTEQQRLGGSQHRMYYDANSTYTNYASQTQNNVNYAGQAQSNNYTGQAQNYGYGYGGGQTQNYDSHSPENSVQKQKQVATLAESYYAPCRGAVQAKSVVPYGNKQVQDRRWQDDNFTKNLGVTITNAVVQGVTEAFRQQNSHQNDFRQNATRNRNRAAITYENRAGSGDVSRKIDFRVARKERPECLYGDELRAILFYVIF